MGAYIYIYITRTHVGHHFNRKVFSCDNFSHRPGLLLPPAVYIRLKTLQNFEGDGGGAGIDKRKRLRAYVRKRGKEVEREKTRRRRV